MAAACLYSRPVCPRRLWRVVGWVGILLVVICGGVESLAHCGRDVTPHSHWRRRMGRIEHHDRCLSILVLVYFAHRTWCLFDHLFLFSSSTGHPPSGRSHPCGLLRTRFLQEHVLETWPRIASMSSISRERVCCLLVLNLVSSTLPCIRQPGQRLRVLGVCDFV